jgi:acetamidase/formamidase
MTTIEQGAADVGASPEEITWGYLPNASARPVRTVPSGTIVCIDTVSHEGILADQGRDPVGFFGALGIPAEQVLADAIAIAGSGIPHDPLAAGPHIIVGPIAVQGAQPGDVLEVETVRLARRSDYGIISNRHGFGALPGEYPLAMDGGPDPAPVCVLATVEATAAPQAPPQGVIRWGTDRKVSFPLNPFLGIMGIAPATDELVHSVPPGPHGGNLDINLLGQSSRLYLPVLAPGALFSVGDPHFAQGDGEVALTAFEAPLRAWVRLTLHQGGSARAVADVLRHPFGETDDSWILIGLDRDLDEAVRQATRQAIAFLGTHAHMDAPVALAYLSAAADFEVSQVVDQVKGVHCIIRKSDLDIGS